LGSGEIRVCSGARRSDAGIQNERDDGKKKVNVEERSDLFSACACMLALSHVILVKAAMAELTDSSELGTDMYYHDHRHYQGQDVHEVICGLEDKSIGDFNRSCIALCLYAGAVIDLLMAYESTQRYRCLFA
jgi:hypothetical protein